MNDKLDELAKGMAQRAMLTAFVVALVGCLACATAAHPATLTVLNTLDKGPGSLRTTLAGAQDGDVIIFDPSLVGTTITLTSDQLSIKKNLDIEGPGAGRLTISGGDVNRVFDIPEQVTATVSGLTITHGFSGGGSSGSSGDNGAGGGGGILNAGNLTVADAVLSYNTAMNHGGAIANAPFGVLTVANTAFVGNQAVSRDPIAFAEAGAVYNSNRGSVAHISDCSFMTNRAFGASGGLLVAGGFAIGQCNGGAIHNGTTSVLTVTNSTFIGNEAIGGNGGSATTDASGNLGSAVGGAIANDENCDGAGLVVQRCNFAYNRAVGGSNNSGGSSGPAVGSGGGGAVYQGGAAIVSDSTFIGNQARGGDGNRAGNGGLQVGVGAGGAIKNSFFICAVDLAVSGCVFANNQAIGGDGNSGGVFVGSGIGGVLHNLSHAFTVHSESQGVAATFTNCTLAGNQAIGGAGGTAGNGGDALGGGFANLFGSSLTVGDCSLTGNRAVGGAGGANGNGGNGLGGGVFNGGLSAVALLGATISLNTAAGGAAGAGANAGLGLGGGANLATGGTACEDTLTSISGNSASTSNNEVYGLLTICP